MLFAFLQVYSTAAMDGLMSHVVVSITISSVCAKNITKLELSLPDSSALKMIRSVSIFEFVFMF